MLQRYAIALIWIGNGLYAKILGYVPRHEQIVGIFFGEEHARTLTVLIGMAELVMAAWVLSGRWPKVCGATQIGVILTMNVLEFTYARHLLLHGENNLVYAVLFCVLIGYHYFVRPRLSKDSLKRG